MSLSFSVVRRGAPPLLLALLAATPAHAQSDTAQADASIVEAFSVVKDDDLDFGLIIPGASAGRITVNRNNGNCNDAGGATLVSGCHRGQFSIIGPSRQRVRLSIDAAPITLNRQGGGASMIMDQLRFNGGQNKRLDIAGNLIFYVGGRLQVGANQAPGLYDATFNVTVDYR